MYLLGIAALTVAVGQSPAKHEDDNPIYQRLLETGLVLGDVKFKLPPPSMPDGLTAQQQKEIIQKLIHGLYEYEEFTRESNVAPQLMKITDLRASDSKVAVRAVDVWFVVYGDLKRLDDDKFLENLVSSTKGDNKTKELTNADLEKRNIAPPKKGAAESYGHVEFDFLEKVRLSATGHATWSRRPGSVVVAAEIDPRFRDDKEFPNRWRSIIKEAGEVKYGDPGPWDGAVLYVKVTRLEALPGALFVEQHILLTEPYGWFEGTNLLRAKLPPAVQMNVRNVRKEFTKK